MAQSCRHSLFAVIPGVYTADVTPDFYTYAQFRQMSLQLVFRNSFATVELIGAGSNLCVNRIPVFQKPSILFFLSLQQTEQDFLDAARTGRLEQFLDSGFKSRVVDFDVHDLIPFLS